MIRNQLGKGTVELESTDVLEFYWIYRLDTTIVPRHSRAIDIKIPIIITTYKYFNRLSDVMVCLLESVAFTMATLEILVQKN